MIDSNSFLHKSYKVRYDRAFFIAYGKSAMRSIYLTGLLLSIGTVSSFAEPIPLCQNADTIYHHAKFITLNPKAPEATAVAVNHHRLVAVGNESNVLKECRGAKTQVVDLQGAVVTPGLINTHAQLVLYGWLKKYSLDLSSTNALQQSNWQATKTLDAFLNRIKQQPPGFQGWILINGYDPALVQGKLLDKAQLDAISETTPIAVFFDSANALLLNSAGVKKITELAHNQSFRAPQDGLIQQHQIHTVLTLLLNKTDIRDALQLAINDYVSKGYTTISETNTQSSWVRILNEMTQENVMKTDLILSSDSLSTMQQINLHAKDNPRLHAGTLLLRVDGALSNEHAFLSMPYFSPSLRHGTDWRGKLNWQSQQLEERMRAAQQAKIGVAFEVNGDAALDIVLNIIQINQRENHSNHAQTFIFNAQVIRPDQLTRIGLLNIPVSWFVSHLYYWGQSMCHEILGAARAEYDSPLASAQKTLTQLALHDISPTVNASPIQSMLTANTRRIQVGNYPVNRQCPEQFDSKEKISLQEALLAQTLGAAKLYHLQRDKGSLIVGKLADMTLFHGDPLTLTKLEDVTIMGTISRGALHLNTVVPLHE